MTELEKNAVTETANLLIHYSFDLKGESVEVLVDRWMRSYPAAWLRLAAIEALYQGRYKAVSVEQILLMWQRRGQTFQHFNHEFERIVSSKLPKSTAPMLELPFADQLFAVACDELPANGDSVEPDPLPIAVHSAAAVNGSSALSEPPDPDRPLVHWTDPDPLPAAQPAIHQFVPDQTTSEFCAKLRAVALQQEKAPIATSEVEQRSEPEEAMP